MKNKEIKEMGTKESLLGLGMMVVAAGTTAVMAGEYVHGGICVGVGFIILYFRGFIKHKFINGLAK